MNYTQSTSSTASLAFLLLLFRFVAISLDNHLRFDRVLMNYRTLLVSQEAKLISLCYSASLVLNLKPIHAYLTI